MIYTLKDKINRLWFNHRCKEILTTPPVTTTVQSNICIVSMVCHRDLLMYIAAIKSFYYHCGIGRIVVLDDGSLTQEDFVILNEHIPSIEIVNIKEISTGKCPKWGCWERLCLISSMVEDNYVIQLDSDTITLRNCSEILEYCNDKVSFSSVGSNSTLRVETMADAAMQAKCSTGTGMQRAIERSFDLYPNKEDLKYLRGNAALAGFARKSFKWREVEEFSLKMESILGSKWQHWGSEQVASNFVIANTPEAKALSYLKYVCHYPAQNWIDFSEANVIHFIGNYRYQNGFYTQVVNDFINKCKRS